jgi:hypothetical protein
MRYAIIESGTVSNVVEANGPMGDNWIECEVGGVDWSYVDGAFIEPAKPTPSRESQEANRRTAYILEADPLFFMSQRGEATTEEWLVKIEEIKSRYPYPEI